jgi:cytochrome c oxidase cbb3-type subunit I/II
MVPFPHILKDDLDASEIEAKMGALRIAGVPYTDADIEQAAGNVTRQAGAIAANITLQQGPKNLQDKEIVALIAYLQRLGTDIQWRPPVDDALSATGTK